VAPCAQGRLDLSGKTADQPAKAARPLLVVETAIRADASPRAHSAEERHLLYENRVETETRRSDRGGTACRAAPCHDDVDLALQREFLAGEAETAHTAPRTRDHPSHSLLSGAADRRRQGCRGTFLQRGTSALRSGSGAGRPARRTARSS